MVNRVSELATVFKDIDLTMLALLTHIKSARVRHPRRADHSGPVAIRHEPIDTIALGNLPKRTPRIPFEALPLEQQQVRLERRATRLLVADDHQRSRRRHLQQIGTRTGLAP